MTGRIRVTLSPEFLLIISHEIGVESLAASDEKYGVVLDEINVLTFCI